ncbi:type IV secretory system conjugative DNA transfer family protein [Haloechinothrix salitolerans]|uniref:Type IV secretory system conjugative DNA transfer family protein n=1 Tax=Haloechinothrix salitolerans TaxID=926830 RepID=A0ABW2C8N3_9PSEU
MISVLRSPEIPVPDGPLVDVLVDPWAVVGRIIDVAIHQVSARGPQIALLFGAAVLSAMLARRWWMSLRQRALHPGARCVTILAPPAVEAGGAHTLWRTLADQLLRPRWKRALLGQPHVAFEYLFSRDTVRIRLWVPGTTPPGIVEDAVEAAWPGALTQATDADSPIQATRSGTAVGGQLRLARPEALPIRIEHPADAIRTLLTAPASLAAEERACVQILARPATGGRLCRTRRAAQRLRRGTALHLAGRLLDAITPGSAATGGRGQQPHPDPHAALAARAQDRAIVEKDLAAGFDTLIRYATYDPTGDRRRLRGRAHALASAFGVFKYHNFYRRTRLSRPLSALAGRRFTRGDLLSVPELAAIAHLPTDQMIPGVQRAGARAVGPPPGIVEPGPTAKPLGVTNTGHPRPVGLRVPDARHHLHVLGSTGSGKSTLLATLVLADADAGRGAVVIDPRGDLVSDILQRLPARVGERVVLFDADDPRHAPCLNPLEGDRHQAAENIVSVFARVFSSAWGPRTDDILRAGCLSLHGLDPRITGGTPATLAHLPRLLTDESFRAKVVVTIDEPILKGFWSWYEQASDAYRAHLIAPVMNKVRAFLLRPFVKHAITGGASTFGMSDVLDGGLLLARLPKGTLGVDAMRLVGSLLVAATWQATTARTTRPERERADASLVIDEAHNFLHLPFPLEDLLAEARAYHLSLVLAHQHLNQLTRDLADGIAANARSKLYFTVSPGDAHQLARHTEPRLSEHDLCHLGGFHAAARLVLHGEESPPFTLCTQPLAPAVPGRARCIRRAASRHAARVASGEREQRRPYIDPRTLP